MLGDGIGYVPEHQDAESSDDRTALARHEELLAAIREGDESGYLGVDATRDFLASLKARLKTEGIASDAGY